AVFDRPLVRDRGRRRRVLRLLPGQPRGVAAPDRRPEVRVSAAVEDDEVWPVRPRGSVLRLKAPTAVLLALLVAAGGVWAGSLLQKRYGAAPAAATGRGSFANIAARFRQGGAFGGAGGGGGVTTGLVTLVKGNVVWLTAADGSLVKVTVGRST